MLGSKIQLSPAEAALVENAEVILTKNRIIQKTVALLAHLQETISAQPELSGLSSPKISKGENYLGLPWVVLDYPRISNGADLLFIRSMFWWGNFFSSTLQATGRYKAQAYAPLLTAYEWLATNHYSIGVGDDPWQHHFDPSNYTTIANLSKSEFSFLLEHQPHIKIAARWPLEQWDVAAKTLLESWKRLAGLVA